MITLRGYQDSISDRGVEILGKYGFLYLSMQVRTGKTLTSIAACHKLASKISKKLNVLFITKKKAILGIIKDIENFESALLDVEVINYESLHKAGKRCWDVVICDEAHSLGAFPKPSKRAKDVSVIVRRCKSYVILLSGTPTPESYSQMYHQVYFIPSNPFRMNHNFYSFANSYCRITEKKINGYNIKDYSDASKVIIDLMSPYTIPYTQEEAGFNSVITEHVLVSDMPQEAYQLLSVLKKHKVANVASGTILCDTASKYMSKVHQICSGTVICENGKSAVLNNEKAIFIRDYFKGKKIAIFYKFKAEYDALESVFGHTLTSSIEEFNSYPEKTIALQIVSGREGISLREADALVYYNIDFSATSYWQSRDRMTTVDRLKNDVYWVFSKGGIESKIYSSVIKKKDYTLNHFKSDYFL